MANDITVAAEPRTLRGKNEARRLRATGSTPAVVYGVGQETFAVSKMLAEFADALSAPPSGGGGAPPGSLTQGPLTETT